MSSVNKVALLGRVGKDPEVKETSGGKIAKVTLATSEKYTDKSGQKQESTEWHNLIVYGKLADVVSKYVSKGDQIYAEGSISTRKWKDKDGNDRYSTEIKVRDIVMLGGSGKQATPSNAGAADDDDLPF